MSEPVFTLKAFAEFCERRGDERYNWGSSSECACAQYAIHLGAWKQWVESEVHDGSFFDVADDIAMQEPRTFSALAARLRERDLNGDPDANSLDAPSFDNADDLIRYLRTGQ